MSTFTIGGDLGVHRLGYGTMRITGDDVWGPPRDHDAAIAVLRRTLELGIDLIDTADSYGPHVSEPLIAEALHPHPDNLVIATKGGLERTGPGQWARNGQPEHLQAAWTRELVEFARAYNATPGQVALARLLARPPVVLPIPGTGSAEHLVENTAACGLALSAEDVARLDAAA